MATKLFFGIWRLQTPEEKNEAEKLALARTQAAERALQLANDISHEDQISKGIVSRVPAELATGVEQQMPVPQMPNHVETIVSDTGNAPGLAGLSSGQVQCVWHMRCNCGSIIGKAICDDLARHIT